MRKLIVCLVIVSAFALSGCASSTVNDSGNPINRSLLIDGGINLGLDIPIIPIPLPKIDLGFKLHYRRPTPREEIELNLSKLGRQLENHNQVDKDKLRSSPAPFRATEQE
jgi:hypothetical protein